MKRLILVYFLLLLACLWLTSCKSKKNISTTTEQTETTTKTQSSDESTTSKTNLLTNSKLQALSNRFHRDGIFNIEFDSLTHIDISPDGGIRATGYGGKISGATSQTNRDTSFTAATTSQLITKDSTGRSENQKEEIDSSIIKETDKEVTITPSITPWLGIGLAASMVVLTLLFFFLGGKKS